MLESIKSAFSVSVWFIVPVLIVTGIVFVLFIVSTGEADSATFENANYSTRFSFNKTLDKKMRYMILPISMRYFKFSMNLLWPYLLLMEISSLIRNSISEPFSPLYLICQIVLIVLALLNVIVLRGVDGASVWTNLCAVFAFVVVPFVRDAGLGINVLTILPAVCSAAWAVCDSVYFFKRKAPVFDPTVRQLRKAYSEKYPDERNQTGA